LPSLYDPLPLKQVAKFWEDNQVYKADPNRAVNLLHRDSSAQRYQLAHGSRLESALIDTLIRYHRMRGVIPYGYPGTDHASIAVQTILEKQLNKGKPATTWGVSSFWLGSGRQNLG